MRLRSILPPFSPKRLAAWLAVVALLMQAAFVPPSFSAANQLNADAHVLCSGASLPQNPSDTANQDGCVYCLAGACSPAIALAPPLDELPLPSGSGQALGPTPGIGIALSITSHPRARGPPQNV
ncbi:exported hypothetical protein [Rhodospirillaceae bacterium LM-1]|nr:exported hypothetical protein [Rhodospirillaceae bacterium LM-1]